MICGWMDLRNEVVLSNLFILFEGQGDQFPSHRV